MDHQFNNKFDNHSQSNHYCFHKRCCPPIVINCPTGPEGPVGPAGPSGITNQSFASFTDYAALFSNAKPMNLYPNITDPLKNITSQSTTALQLQPGFYHISYAVSTLLTTPGYMQITPYYNQYAHIENGIYSKTGVAQTTAEGSQTFIIEVKEPTIFTLTFNSNVAHTDGQLSLSIIKLESCSS